MSTSSEITLGAKNLSKVYGTGDLQVHALRNVDLELAAGELVVFLGPSGSGKSTLLNIMGGLDVPSSGSVHFGDQDITGADSRELTMFRRNHVGFVFQFYNLLPSLTALENVALWHERDISHSSVERVIGPDSTLLLDFMLFRMTRVIDGLVVYPENMKRNMKLTEGLTFSQRFLLALVDKGVDRQEAYVLVQRNAMPVWEEGKDFQEMLLADAGIRAHLSEEEIGNCFDLQVHLRHVDTLFERVFGKEA